MPPAGEARSSQPTAGQTPRGGRLGLLSTGPGSLAPTGRRLGALIVDCIASSPGAGVFTAGFAWHSGANALPVSWSLIPFALDSVLGLPLLGRTLGMNLFGIRVVRVDAPRRITVLDATVRTILLVLLIPALIWDRNARGLHDRLARTAVVLS